MNGIIKTTAGLVWGSVRVNRARPIIIGKKRKTAFFTYFMLFIMTYCLKRKKHWVDRFVPALLFIRFIMEPWTVNALTKI